MTLMEAVSLRHSVRRYTDEPLRPAHISALNAEIAKVNEESGLSIQLITHEPKAFDGLLNHYGWITGVTNYLALVGKDDEALEPLCGYWGEHLTLFAQTLGVNSCWAAGTYRKIPDAYTVRAGEKMLMLIALGYGENQGKPHKGKTYRQVTDAPATAPEWFQKGVECALLAPTAINQQKFKFTLGADGKTVTAEAQKGPWSMTDLGIVRYHFELAAGKDNFTWG